MRNASEGRACRAEAAGADDDHVGVVSRRHPEDRLGWGAGEKLGLDPGVVSKLFEQGFTAREMLVEHAIVVRVPEPVVRRLESVRDHDACVAGMRSCPLERAARGRGAVVADDHATVHDARSGSVSHGLILPGPKRRAIRRSPQSPLRGSTSACR